MVYYVIFGYKLNKNNNIHQILKNRLDFFIKKYKKGDKVILSGGNTNKNTHTEAYIMSKYIRKHIDISKNDILLENKSLNTIQNIFFTFKLFKRININKLTVISSIWHLNRIKKIIDYVSERSFNITLLGSKKIHPKNKKETSLIKNEIKKMEKTNKLFK